MISCWDDLDFWFTGEWQVIQERLEDMEKAKTVYNPKRELMFAALDATPYDKTTLMIMGQDPYPDHDLATGLAFSIPKKYVKYPPTLQNFLREYQEDLHLSAPSTGDLSSWTSQGVLLWNAIPSCEEGKPGSHRSWVEWDTLTQEIVEALSEKGICFLLLGGLARSYEKFIDNDANMVVVSGHPSPRGSLNAKTPFAGSRVFSTCNAKLRELKLPAIDWRLP